MRMQHYRSSTNENAGYLHYRICSGCAAVDVPGVQDSSKKTVENLLASQFRNQMKVKPTGQTPDVENALPGQIR